MPFSCIQFLLPVGNACDVFVLLFPPSVPWPRSSELRFQPRSEKTPNSVLLIAVALPRLFWLSVEIEWEGQVNSMKPRLCVGFPGDSEVKNLPPMQETHSRDTDLIWRVEKTRWGRKWQSIAVFLPRKSHQQVSLISYSSWGHKRVGHDLATNSNKGFVWPVSPKQMEMGKKFQVFRGFHMTFWIPLL